MHTKYIKQLIIATLLFAIPVIGFNALFLFNTGELLSSDQIVEQQLAAGNDFLVGLATRDLNYHYKLSLVKKTKPDLLILGSSRVVEFKKEFFSQSMMNAGRGVSNINECFSFIKELFSEHVPRMIIIGVDYWWFDDKHHAPSLAIVPPEQRNNLVSLRSYLLPFVWLAQSKISFKDYLTNINPHHVLGNHNPKGIGVNALVNHNGFASDGSYLYTKIFSGKNVNDKRFMTSINQIEKAEWIFRAREKVNDVHYKNFIEMVRYLKKYNTKVIFFIPPMAPTVIKKMDEYSDQYSHIEDLRNRLKHDGVDFIDLHDPQSLATNNCEFIDGFHGGEVTYAKIVAKLAEKNTGLLSYINQVYIDKVTKNFSNLAMIPRADLPGIETDFNELGCDKSAQYALSNNLALKQ
jgi:hypothetical protein